MNLIIWEMHRFSHRFPMARENATKAILWREPPNWYLHFSRNMGTFFPSDSHPVVYFSTWEKHRFSLQFPIAGENATKPIVWVEPEKLMLILFP